MARIPGESDFGGIPSLRSGRQIAREDTSALAAGVDALGAGIRQLGAGAVAVATDMAKSREQLETFNAESGFQRFMNAEQEGMVTSQRGVAAGGAGAFPQTWEFGEDGESGFNSRARAFMEGIPEHLRPAFDARMTNFAGGLRSSAQDFSLGEQIRFTGQQLDDTLNNTILPRIATAAALPDDASRQAALNQIIADGEALIRSSPYLSPVEMDAAINGHGDNPGWRARAQMAFNNALDPALRDRWLGQTPSPEQAIGYLGELAPNLNVDALTPEFSTRLAQAAMDYERETGQQARFTSFARTTEQQAQLYADYLLAHGMGESFVFNGVTYRGNPNNPVGLAAPPGQSRHEGGAAADIADGPFLQWMHANGARYGLGFLSGDAFTADPGHVQLSAGGGPLPAPAARLDALPYEQRNALAADAATQRVAQANALATAQAAENAAYVNAAQIGARDASYGYAQLQRDVASGRLTDYDDIHKIETAIEEYQGDVRGLAAAQTALADPAFQWLPGDNGHQDMVDRLWEATPALQEALVAPGADQAQRQAAQASLAALVDRTGILPEGAANAIIAGLESNDPAQMAAAVALIDALGQVDHFAVGRALTQEQGTAAATLATAVDIVGRTGNDEVFRRVAGELALIQSTPNYKPPTRDPDAERTAITEELGEAYRFLPSHQADVLAVAGHIFNSMARERGVPNDLSTDASIELFETALQMAAGAQYVDGVQYGGTTDVHGIDTLVPMGVRADEVERAFDALTDEELEGLGGAPVSANQTLKVDAVDVRSGILVAVGDGVYRVAAEITPTGTPVFYANAAGDFWTIDMRRLLEMREKAALAAEAPAGTGASPYDAPPRPEPLPTQEGVPDGYVRLLGGAVVPRAGRLQPPTVTPLPLREGGTLMQFEPAPDQPPMTAAEARAEAERRAQAGAAPPPVPTQESVPEGHVRLLGGAVVPIAEGASELKQRIKQRLERNPPAEQRREPKDEEAARTERMIAARKRMMALRTRDTARVPPTVAPAPAGSPAAASAAAASPPLPPEIRRSSANGIRSGASEVPMDHRLEASIPPLLPVVTPAPGAAQRNASYPRPGTVATVPVERRPLPPLPPEPTAMPWIHRLPADAATPAIRNRDVMAMTLPELDWFLNYGDPTGEELRQMGVRIELLQEQGEVNAIVAGAR